MSEFIKRMEKKYGEYVFVNDEMKEGLDIISTGSLSLDVSTGVGGIPKGRITVIYGDYSTGKTTVCLSIVKNEILNGGKVLYIDTESGLDYNYVQAIVGEFDVSNLVIAQPDVAEDALQLAEFGIRGNESMNIEPGEFSLIIVDSLGATATEKEKEKELTEPTVAGISKTVTVFLKRNAIEIRKRNIAFVIVNQVRDNIGSYSGGYVMPGGHALKHFSSLILFFGKGETIKQVNKPVGMYTKFTVRKNKLSIPFRSFDMPIKFGVGIDFYRDVIEFSKMLGVLRKKGPYYFFGEEQLGLGMDKTAEYLKTYKDTLDKIVDMCYNIVDKNIESEDDELGLEDIIE